MVEDMRFFHSSAMPKVLALLGASQCSFYISFQWQGGDVSNANVFPNRISFNCTVALFVNRGFQCWGGVDICLSVGVGPLIA